MFLFISYSNCCSPDLKQNTLHYTPSIQQFFLHLGILNQKDLESKTVMEHEKLEIPPLTLQSIDVQGHEFTMTLQIAFQQTLYLRVNFALHAQVLLCNQIGYHRDIISNPTVRRPCIVTIGTTNPIFIIFSDHNRLLQFTLSFSTDVIGQWGLDRGPDPILEWDKFHRAIKTALDQVKWFLPKQRERLYSKSIYHYIKDNYTLFNGFGNNHTTEALYYARIHPFTPVSDIVSNPDLINRLVGGLHQACQRPPDWNKYISENSYLTHPLHYNLRAATYYMTSVNKVYGKKQVMVSKENYEAMLNDGQITSSIRNMKSVRYTTQSMVRLPVWQVYIYDEKDNKKRKSSTVYTAIETFPMIPPYLLRHGSPFHYEKQVGEQHDPKGGVPRTGPDNFHNVLSLYQFRKAHTRRVGRRLKVQIKKSGRPLLRHGLKHNPEPEDLERRPKHKLMRSGKQRRM